jgi:hypothetical protein
VLIFLDPVYPTLRYAALGGAQMQRRPRMLGALALALAAAGAPARAQIVRGGGGRATDCISIFVAPSANTPAPPHVPRHVDCIDGTDCDADGLENARCEFDVTLCVNSTGVTGCDPVRANTLTIDHANDNGDPRFDVDFQALQSRADQLDLPGDETLDDCAASSTVTVVLRGPTAAGVRLPAKKKLTLSAFGFASGRAATDRDRIRFTCRPRGDGIYTSRDLYAGTFDRIAQEVFAPSCAKSGCHDSDTHQKDMILLPNAAYSQTVGVVPTTPAAAAAGLERIFPGDPHLSFIYRKITGDLEPGFGFPMPLTGPAVSPALTEIIRLWILGDGTIAPASATGWVVGTDG